MIRNPPSVARLSSFGPFHLITLLVDLEISPGYTNEPQIGLSYWIEDQLGNTMPPIATCTSTPPWSSLSLAVPTLTRSVPPPFEFYSASATPTKSNGLS
ncbi:hypothetical protein RSOLAG1IB_09702 [Rhizoctonia solani AG-1 IB]|uniref:Uncharacterized protein n=1 Tax=Thanatephorus cucumeris (strain AG1-IB / isolate 7/3/14) TaxID=1108050 RepID=A0A0B7FS63_THACB|nr:hypothetical protein RSOLAG1IB_09702 [Rhizoctonia solani AG-1 IB]